MKRYTLWKCNSLTNNSLNSISPPTNYSIRKSSSNGKWTRDRIEDYTCEWNFPIRTLLGIGRRNEVIEELRTKHGAVRPLVVTDNNIQKLPIIQVKNIMFLTTHALK